MVKSVVVFTSIILVCILVIPAIVVQFIPQGVGQVQEVPTVQQVEQTQATKGPIITVAVYREAKGIIEQVNLEEYIQGVVAAEMPTDFELEALKAQALAARTYIVRRLVEKDFSDVPEGALVTDTIQHQVYLNEEELQERWGFNYERNRNKIQQAVMETVGQVLTYEGKPITATFFSTSNGYTENSEDYWNAELPYLRSVESPWDEESPRFEEVIRMGIQEFQQKLGVTLTQTTSTNQDQPVAAILSRTAGNRVKEVKVGDQTFSGKDLREKLEISSSHFDINLDGQELVIRTKGWGHGVGMSQWGANGMAKEGYGAEEIVKYYYQGIDVQDYRDWIVQK
ncbi:stage II sporulation protein D [Bacillus horti]|uniref:Stage II sporulation protein D n=1 Tax=Caldalkalibacillus horti TaxID=77523 RepID=A0ABT9VZK3_9BACI|nr:stage II sporulation protein D [Bacillus horti]MDQ0166433.1 stage II sporulation protein D [Bacillus horti]